MYNVHFNISYYLLLFWILYLQSLTSGQFIYYIYLYLYIYRNTFIHIYKTLLHTIIFCTII